MSIMESLRKTRVCMACLGKPRDTTMEDQVAEEKKLQLEEMMKYGIFQPTETVEVVNPVNGETPNEHYTVLLSLSLSLPLFIVLVYLKVQSSI